MGYPQFAKKEIPELYLVTVTTPEGKVYKNYVVLGTSLYDPSGTAGRYKELCDGKVDGCKVALNWVENMNRQETEEGDPMYPANYKVFVEPMEFEAGGIEEV